MAEYLTTEGWAWIWKTNYLRANDGPHGQTKRRLAYLAAICGDAQVVGEFTVMLETATEEEQLAALAHDLEQEILAWDTE